MGGISGMQMGLRETCCEDFKLERCPMAAFCDHGEELWGSVNTWNFSIVWTINCSKTTMYQGNTWNALFMCGQTRWRV